MDAQQINFRLRVGRTLGIAFGLGTQVGFLATVWYLFWFLYGDDLVSRVTSRHWFAIDLLLALLFAIPHSVLLLPPVRKTITSRLPSALYGSLFCVATCVSLSLIFTFWEKAPTAVWHLHGPAAWSLRTAFVASWLTLFYSLSLSGFGYQTGWTQWLYWLRREPLPRRGMVDRGAYRVLRHPAYLSFLGLIWFTPIMTLDHALLTAIWTIYVFVGSCLKDQRLVYFLGDTYREYASRVPGYPGIPFGSLGRWPQPTSAAGGPSVQIVAPRAA